MSRSTQMSNINFVRYNNKPVFVGYIYKITDINNKIYIGSTNNHVKRWKQHQEANEDMPLHRAVKELGKENFKFEIIKQVDWFDEEQLLIHESCCMDEYNSIVCGYNTKHSIDMQNLF